MVKKITGKNYKERCMSQVELWAGGISLHNKVDGECCPDFSCCKYGVHMVSHFEDVWNGIIYDKNIIDIITKQFKKTLKNMLTPLFEIKKATQDRFISLSYDDKGNVSEYKYLDGAKKISDVKMPNKAFDRLVLATLEDGRILYMDKSGKIDIEEAPLGL